MKFSLRVLALALLLSPLSSRATIQAGNDGLESVWGAEYRSFQSNLVTLRYDITLEPLARQLFPRIHAHLQKLQQEMGFKLNRPFPVFLLSRAFGNAFVAFPTVASPSFSVISPRLSAVELSSPTFLYAGDEEDFFDT
ncbi:MAG: hypothetical protein ABIR96_12055, partial [Bdellovibrionota bacterium]